VNLPPYPKYKSSGVEWLGDVPEHWEVKRLKFVTDTLTSGVWGEDPDADHEGVPVATTANITRQGLLDVPGMNRRLLSAEEARKGLCQPGDTIVVKSSGSATNVISGKAGYVLPEHGGVYFNNFTMRVRPRPQSTDPKFTWYFLSSEAVQSQVRLMVSTTTYPNLQVPEYLSFLYPKAPVHEHPQSPPFWTGGLERWTRWRKRGGP
jgi:type I restriction enzyme S subunit